MSKSYTFQSMIGSMKKRIVSSDFKQERKYRNLDNKEVAKLKTKSEEVFAFNAYIQQLMSPIIQIYTQTRRYY